MSSAPAPVLSLTDVTKQYAGTSTPAVSGLSLDVHEGEILSVTGESGSGKTTLLRIIAGLEVPDRGLIFLNGREVCAPGRRPVPPERRGVGMVFQNYALFPHLTVRQNVLYGVDRSLSGTEKETILAAVLGLTGLCGFESRYPHEISGGQQQRVALARALAPRPAIILLDEPFSNLDVSLRQQLREDVSRILRAARTTALLVTHDTRDALAVSDRIAVMRHGILQQLDTPEGIYRRPANKTTALLFGRMNFLPPGTFGSPAEEGPVWVRPEHLELAAAGSPDQPPAAGSLRGTVLRTHFHGDRLEVVLSCRTADGGLFELTAAGDPLLPWRTGLPARVSRKNRQDFPVSPPASREEPG